MVPCLPYTTQRVDVLRTVTQEGWPVGAARSAHHTLAGWGVLATATAVILWRGRKMNDRDRNRISANRIIKVQTGDANLSVTGAVDRGGFFTAPDPSSSWPVPIAGRVRDEFGAARIV